MKKFFTIQALLWNALLIVKSAVTGYFKSTGIGTLYSLSLTLIPLRAFLVPRGFAYARGMARMRSTSE
jgi:hypothetical protein